MFNKTFLFEYMGDEYDRLVAVRNMQNELVEKFVSLGHIGKDKEHTESIKKHFFWKRVQPNAEQSYKVRYELEDVVSFDAMPEPLKRFYEECFNMIWRDAIADFNESVYFHFWSRGSDQCESDRVERFSGWYQAADYIKDFYDGAEGPCFVTQITAEVYLKHTPETRDRRAEQYNY